LHIGSRARFGRRRIGRPLYLYARRPRKDGCLRIFGAGAGTLHFLEGVGGQVVQVAHQGIELLLEVLALLAETGDFLLHIGHRFFGRLVGFFHDGAGALAGLGQGLLGQQLGLAAAQVGIALSLLGDGIAGVLGRFEGAVERRFYLTHFLHVVLRVLQLETQLAVFVAQALPLLRHHVEKSLHLLPIYAPEGLFKCFLPNIEGGNFHK